MEQYQPAPAQGEVAFLRRVLIVLGVVVLALFAWQVRGALLLAFGAVVSATLMLAAAQPFRERFGLSDRWALLAGGAALLVLLALVLLLIGAPLRAQLGQLAERLPEAARALEARFGVRLPSLGEEGAPGLPEIGGVIGRVAAFGRTLVDALSALVLVVVGGAYLAASADSSLRGVVKLLPPSRHARAEEVLRTMGRALHQWLLATLMAMGLVAVLVALGAWLIGLPSPLALGLFAGLAEFIPVVGPVLGAVPVLLLALTQGAGHFAWALALVLAVQQLEANMITPMIQQRMVEVPPALLLFSIVAFGAVFDLAGVVLAGPLTVVALVAVRMLYQRQTLGERVTVPGEDPPGPAGAA